MTTVFVTLRAALKADDSHARLAAAWEVLDLGRQAADAIVWQDGYDEVQALAAGQEAVAGRALLPLPGGSPVSLSETTPPAAAESAGLLDRAAVVLRQLGEEPAAEHAEAAARCLRAARKAG